MREIAEQLKNLSPECTNDLKELLDLLQKEKDDKIKDEILITVMEFVVPHDLNIQLRFGIGKKHGYEKAMVIYENQYEQLGVQGFIWPNHYDHSITSYICLLKEAQQTFPELQMSNCECRTIKSGEEDGKPILKFPLLKHLTGVEGWQVHKNSLPFELG